MALLKDNGKSIILSEKKEVSNQEEVNINDEAAEQTIKNIIPCNRRAKASSKSTRQVTNETPITNPPIDIDKPLYEMTHEERVAYTIAHRDEFEKKHLDADDKLYENDFYDFSPEAEAILSDAFDNTHVSKSEHAYRLNQLSNSVLEDDKPTNKMGIQIYTSNIRIRNMNGDDKDN